MAETRNPARGISRGSIYDSPIYGSKKKGKGNRLDAKTFGLSV
jgi:hypothetical protein